MSVEIGVVFALIAIALVLFATEVVPVEMTALGVMAALMVSGILTPEEAVSGFSNIATITIGALFVITAGLRQTGVIELVGQSFTRLARQGPTIAIATLLVVAAVLSGFVNNTIAVAIFIPLAIGLAAQLEISPSKLLIPLSMASMFGGVMTLIGTSTNLIVDSVVRANGLEGFGMFEFTPLGAIMLACALPYLLWVGVRILPDRRKEAGLAADYGLGGYIAEIRLGEGAKSIGGTPAENAISDAFDVEVLDVLRGEEVFSGRDTRHTLREGDVLRLRGSSDELATLLSMRGNTLAPASSFGLEHLAAADDVLVEAVVAPDSSLVGRRLGDVSFSHRYLAQVLALRARGRLRREKLDQVTLQGGTSLLLKLAKQGVERLQHSGQFLVVSEVSVPGERRSRMPVAVGIAAGVVLAAALGLTSIMVSAVAGALLMVAAGCLRVEDAYESIQWPVIFLLAGFLSVGVAMETTGATELLVDGMLDVLEPLGDRALVAGFFLLAFALTELISNNATAVLLAPVAIGAAATVGVDPRPLLIAVTFAASFSFLTPTGYQTNLLVYGPGQYRYTDYARVGAPLTVIVSVIAIALIPVFWPL